MVGTTLNKQTYSITSSSSGAMPIPFRYDAENWIFAVAFTSEGSSQSTLSLGSDFNLSGDGSETLGQITLSASFLETVTGSMKLVVYRIAPALQTLDLQYNTRLPAEALETTLDHLAMASIDRSNTLQRTFTLPFSDPDSFASSYQIEGANERKGTVMAFRDNDGLPVRLPYSDLANQILRYVDLGNVGEEVLAAISALSPIEVFTDPPTDITGHFGQLAIHPESVDLIVTGTLSPDITGTILPWKTENGKIAFSTNGVDPTTLLFDPVSVSVEWSGNSWVVRVYENGALPNPQLGWASFPGSWNSDPYPTNVGLWIPFGGSSGMPDFTITNENLGQLWVNIAQTGLFPEWREIIISPRVSLVAGGPPSVGSFERGDEVNTQTGELWRCYEGGSPGLWVQVGNENKIQIGPGAQKKDWHGVVRYPGKLGPSFVCSGNNRIFAAPYPLDDDSAISFIKFEVLNASNDSGAELEVAIFDDHRGCPGRLLWSEKIDYTVIGRKALTVDPPIPGGQWLWITFTGRGIVTDGGEIAGINHHPYELQGGVENYYVEGYDAVSLYGNDVSDPLPVRWPKFIDFNLYDRQFPLVSFNMKANPNRTDPTRHTPDRSPVMIPLDGEDACQEPCMHYFPNREAGRRYVLWFSAGWGGGQTIVWADGPSPDGPWTRRGSFGSGGRGNVYAEGGTVYHYMSPNSGVPGGGITCRFGSSPEEIQSCTPVTVLSGLQAETPNLTTPYQNTGIAKRGTGDYVMMFESIDSVNNPTTFQTGYATGTNPLGPFTAQEWPVTSLRQTITNSPAAGHVSAGQPYWDPVSELFRMYYHAGDYVNTPSEIFHATSEDCETWTVDPQWRVRREHPLEYDQVADPFYFKDPVSGIGYLFWSAVDNEAGRGCIMRSNPSKLTIEI